MRRIRSVLYSCTVNINWRTGFSSLFFLSSPSEYLCTCSTLARSRHEIGFIFLPFAEFVLGTRLFLSQSHLSFITTPNKFEVGFSGISVGSLRENTVQYTQYIGFFLPLNLQTLFRSSFLNDKTPVVVLKDVDFENLRALVEYMYKGEANVPQHMLQSFIRTAESLQIRGLAEGGPKSVPEEGPSSSQSSSASTGGPHVAPPMPMFPPGLSGTPPLSGFRGDRKSGGNSSSAGSGILAARLAKLGDDAGLGRPFFDIDAMIARQQQQQQQQHSSGQKRARKPERGSGGGHNLPPHIEVGKRNRKSPPVSSKPSGSSSLPLNKIFPNNNYDEEGALKIDEDADLGKENRNNSRSSSPTSAPKVDDDIIDLEASNGVDSDEEEEASVPGPSMAGNGSSGNAGNGGVGGNGSDPGVADLVAGSKTF